MQVFYFCLGTCWYILDMFFIIIIKLSQTKAIELIISCFWTDEAFYPLTPLNIYCLEESTFSLHAEVYYSLYCVAINFNAV